MNYTSFKWMGAISWALTYICFIAIAQQFSYAMVPLVVCSYNISYELIYTINADSRSQRLRNGLWFTLDLFIISFHLENLTSVKIFLFWFTVASIIQILTTVKINKQTVKGFAWFITCLMSIIMLEQNIPASCWVLSAVIFKTLGDGFYGIAHLKWGLPEKEKINSFYYMLIQIAIIMSFILNILLLNKIV